MAGQSWGYTYDAIGNRSSMTRSAAAVRQADATLGPATSFTTSYTPNAVNQYAQIDPPQAIEVAGLTVPEVTQVSVNGAPTTGRPPGNGEPGGFSLWLEGAALGTWPQVSIQATRTGARANGGDLTTVRSGHVYVRPQELPTYDPDGNLLSDAGWQYEWDADNRLILAQQKEPGLPADMAQKRIRYHYDWMSRLVSREESERRTLNDGTGLRSDTWTLVKTTHHYYDGWNLMAEVESGATVSVAGSPSPKVRRYLHGLDLSNTHEVGLANGPRTSTTATGGVGTLLGVIAPDDRLYSACTEVNGNLTGFIEASTGALAARFDYDAFGNVVTDWSAPGHNAAEISPIRFSTKLQDPETGWLWYGYRWYDPVNGRWTAKDPIAEAGGLNLYGMVGNDAVNGVDVLGRESLNDERDALVREALKKWRESLKASVDQLVEKLKSLCPAPGDDVSNGRRLAKHQCCEGASCLKQAEEIGEAIRKSVDNVAASRADLGYGFVPNPGGWEGNRIASNAPDGGVNPLDADAGYGLKCFGWQELVMQAFERTAGEYQKGGGLCFGAAGVESGRLGFNKHAWVLLYGPLTTEHSLTNGSIVIDPWPSGGSSLFSDSQRTPVRMGDDMWPIKLRSR